MSNLDRAHPASQDRAGGPSDPSPSVSAVPALIPLRVGKASLFLGDCLATMTALEPDSVDSCVCDPPYHLQSIVKRFANSPRSEATENTATPYGRTGRGFMGQRWDGGDIAFRPETWAAVYRVLKPGAHLVAFSGTRTYHRMVCAIEDAGFEIRDQLAWVYGSGFPKSHNQPGGWGTALKPAWEPICLARKPLVGTVAANVLAHGTGAINIDGCRIEAGADNTARALQDIRGGAYAGGNGKGRLDRMGGGDPLGRWPANIIHDGSEEVLAHFPSEAGGRDRRVGIDPGQRPPGFGNVGSVSGSAIPNGALYGDSGSAARFFYCAKTSAAERHAGCDDFEKGNSHPTVKPIDLMRYLTRLVTPKGGLVLDPFAGSGSTLIAASWEGFRSIGCELSPEYLALAERRLTAVQKEIEDSQRQLSMFMEAAE